MSGPELPPPAVLFPVDLELIVKLLPRAQIVVGDIPRLYPTLQRIERAAQSGHTFIEDRPGPADGEPS